MPPKSHRQRPGLSFLETYTLKLVVSGVQETIKRQACEATPQRNNGLEKTENQIYRLPVAQGIVHSTRSYQVLGHGDCYFFNWSISNTFLSTLGTTLTVDAFCYGKVSDCTGYFLSHFHSDHYTRLASNWRHGPIYCSKVTANLVIQQLRVDPQWVKPLPMDVECQIENSNVTVTLIDANHCPGSAILLFKVPQPNGNGHLRYLHTGDFRAAPKMCLHPQIIQPANPHIDILYLDTTYLDPRYAFPAQEESVMAACQIVMQRVMKEKEIEDDDPVNPRLETFFASSRASSVADKSSSELNEPSNVEPEGESENASFEAFNDEEEVREEEEEDMDDFSYDANFFENVNQIEREGSSISSSLNSTDDWKCAPDSSSSPSVDVPQNQTLVVVGTYSIGKEKIFYGKLWFMVQINILLWVSNYFFYTVAIIILIARVTLYHSLI
jgi:hypothetical protein